MTKAEEYLARAATCERLAKGLTDQQMKQLLTELADQWRHLASLAWETQNSNFR